MSSIRITKRKDVYQYRFEIASENGKRKYINKSGFKTKAEALEAGTIAFNEYINAGKPFKECKMSYSDYLDYWIDNYCKNNLKYNTIQTYTTLSKKYIKPYIGHYRMCNITSLTLNSFITDLVNRYDFSRDYFRNMLKIIKGSFRDACNLYGFIKYNPALTIRMPKMDVEKKEDKHLYTKEEIDLILNRFKDDSTFICAFLTACFTGMRTGELFALTWEDIVEKGYNNKKAHNNLVSLKYKHFGFNEMQDTLQPRWMHVIDINGRSEEEIQKDMESKTRQILRKNEKLGVVTREITRDELPIFKDIMQQTSDRREFIDRPLSYYEDMWDTLYDSGILKIMIAEADFNLYEENTIKEKEELEKALKDRIYKHDNNLLKMNEKKYKSTNKQEEERIDQLNKQLDKIQEYKKEYGDKTLLGGILFLIYGNEVLSLFGGSLETLMNFQSAYTLHYAGIKYAIDNNYKRYNFYGITGDFRKENPLYGLYLFKKSFGGKVVELIGEYDLIVSPFYYHTYNIMYATYHNLKKIVKKIKK